VIPHAPSRGPRLTTGWETWHDITCYVDHCLRQILDTRPTQVLSIWLFTFPFPGLYSDKYLLLFPGLSGIYFQPLSVMSKYKFQAGWCDVDALDLYTLYEVTGSNLSWVTSYLDWSFLWFSSVLSGKFIGSTSIWPRQVWLKSIHICHSMAILL